MSLLQQLSQSLLETFRGFHGAMQLTYGVWKVLGMPYPRVSIFGGSRLKTDSTYSQKAHQLAHKLAQNKLSVLTGGGPGIMEAANCGAAHETKERTMGIGVRNLPGELGINACAQDNVLVDYFWVRKLLLLRYSIGFVIFPGGFGTLGELTDLLTLMQTKKMAHVPIILVGVDYWSSWIAWADQAEKEGCISMEERALLVTTDDLDWVVTTLIKHCKNCS